MKKFVIILLVVCLVFAAAAGYLLGRKVVAEEPQPTQTPAEATADSQQAASPSRRRLWTMRPFMPSTTRRI